MWKTTSVAAKGVNSINNKKMGHNPGNIPSPSKQEDSIFCKTNKSYWMKINITILSTYKNCISIKSVISISLTQTIPDLILVVGCCQEFAKMDV